jgi:hypothetical protein
MGDSSVVPEPHVESRLVLLDEIVLEDEDHLGRDHDGLHVRNGRCSRRLAGVEIRGEVLRTRCLSRLAFLT